jgi:hypothetical protein
MDHAAHASSETDVVDGDEFIAWMKRNKLFAYQQQLEEEGQCYDCLLCNVFLGAKSSFSIGYDDLQSLALLADDQIEALSSAINMRPGHRLKFPFVIKELKELKEKQKRERAKREAKEEREEREEVEQERMTQELAKIDRQLRLQQAKAAAANNSKGLGMPVTNANIENKGIDLSATSLAHTRSQTQDGSSTEVTELSLPPNKLYHFFASHKVSSVL